MNPNSRLWIYQADKPFTVNDDIRSILDTFISQWKAHQNQLFASYEIVYNQFIMIAVDEELAAASGCSIDSSVRVIKQIEDKSNVSLLNRMLLAYKTKNKIEVISRAEFAQGYKIGRFNLETIVFNNTIQYVKELPLWEVRAEHSWHSEAFSNQ